MAENGNHTKAETDKTTKEKTMNNNQNLYEFIMTIPEIKDRLESQIGAILNLDAPEDLPELELTIESMLDPDHLMLLIGVVLDTSGGTDEMIRKYLHLIKRRYANQTIDQILNNI